MTTLGGYSLQSVTSRTSFIIARLTVPVIFDSTSTQRDRDSSSLSAGRSFLLLLVIFYQLPKLAVLSGKSRSRRRSRAGVDLVEKFSSLSIEDELHSIDYCLLVF